jgi:hypothetical protein
MKRPLQLIQFPVTEKELYDGEYTTYHYHLDVVAKYDYDLAAVKQFLFDRYPDKPGHTFAIGNPNVSKYTGEIMDWDFRRLMDNGFIEV